MTSQVLSLLGLGIGTGSVYALGAVGLALIVRFSGILHFAHGAAFILGSYLLLALTSDAHVPVVVAAVVAIAGAAALGPVTYLLVYRPLERRGIAELGFVISSFGVLVIAQNALTLIFGSTARRVSLPAAVSLHTWRAGGVTIRAADVLAPVVAGLAIGGLVRYRQRTRTGLLLRALERNKQLAADLGIGYRRYAPLVFALGSALAGLSALLSALTVPVAPAGGLSWTVSAYIGMAVGGTASVWGAALGGLTLGVLTTVPQLWISDNWNIVLVFAVLVAALLVLPDGLLPGRSPTGRSTTGRSTGTTRRRATARPTSPVEERT